MYLFADSSTMERRRESACERITDDERLRGELEDDEYLPIQEWALTWADAYARSTAGVVNDEAATSAIDAGLQWVRRIVDELVQVLGTWESLDEAERTARLCAIAPLVPAPGLLCISILGNAPINEAVSTLPLPRE